MTFLIAVVLGIGLPLAWMAWRDSRRRNPAVRWPELAAPLGMKFLAEPPRLEGPYKGKTFRVMADGAGASVTTGLRGRAGLRVEIGPRESIEKAAGMVVHDRVQLNDSVFEKRYCVRATPQELGESAADPSIRQRLMGLPDVHILALHDRVVMRVPFPTEAAELRDYLDIAVSVAESLV